MRPFKKCPQCGFISKDEIFLEVPAFAHFIKPEWVCKCSPEASKALQESKERFDDLIVRTR